MMAKIEIEQDLTKEIEALIADIDGERCVTSIKSRVGTVKFKDRRVGQVHLTVTADKDEFLTKPRNK